MRSPYYILAAAVEASWVRGAVMFYVNCQKLLQKVRICWVQNYVILSGKKMYIGVLQQCSDTLQSNRTVCVTVMHLDNGIYINFSVLD